MNDSHVRGRLIEIFENTIESGELYDGPCDDPDYYRLFCRAGSNDQLFKLMNNNICMFNCKYKDKDAVIMIFSIPINSGDSGAKNIAERVMRVITEVEECFVTLDFVKSEEVKEDKFIYIIAVKRVKP